MSKNKVVAPLIPHKSLLPNSAVLDALAQANAIESAMEIQKVSRVIESALSQHRMVESITSGIRDISTSYISAIRSPLDTLCSPIKNLQLNQLSSINLRAFEIAETLSSMPSEDLTDFVIDEVQFPRENIESGEIPDDIWTKQTDKPLDQATIKKYVDFSLDILNLAIALFSEIPYEFRLIILVAFIIKKANEIS